MNLSQLVEKIIGKLQGKNTKKLGLFLGPTKNKNVTNNYSNYNQV